MSQIERKLIQGVVFVIIGIVQYGVIANLALAWVIGLVCFAAAVYNFFDASKLWYDSQT
jgi:hypothetical protein